MTGRPRLVIALVVAMLLVTFLGYQLVGASDQLLVSVAQLRANQDGAAHKTVQLTGQVVSAPDMAGDRKRFVLKDDGGRQTLAVNYSGAVPPAFKIGRRVIVTGAMSGAVFMAQPGSLLTKCPSKYSAGGSGQ
ncbi:MAG TPA: cytochrome c maturation protein CcmE [Gaiellales bacterium]|nr:cytochrome c maturation protein CcmE [Gaiellales bacterium]